MTRFRPQRARRGEGAACSRSSTPKHRAGAGCSGRSPDAIASRQVAPVAVPLTRNGHGQAFAPGRILIAILVSLISTGLALPTAAQRLLRADAPRSGGPRRRREPLRGPDRRDPAFWITRNGLVAERLWPDVQESHLVRPPTPSHRRPFSRWPAEW